MTAAGFGLKDVCSSLARGWQRFFHAPCDARVPALLRICFALLVLVNLAVLLPDLDRWFTENGTLSTAASQAIARPAMWSVFWWLPSTSAVVATCYWIAVVQAALLLVGLASRFNVVCLFVWLNSFQNRNFLITDSEDVVMRLLAFYLIWMPIERCWSMDAWLWQRLWPKNSASRNYADGRFAAPGWGPRLLQIQMCVIFLSAGLSKLGGDAWLNGTALYYVARLDDYFGRFPAPDWPFNSPWAVAALTWSVIAVELLVPVLIWFRETRRPALAAAVLFHLGNEWTMHLFLFHWAMLVGWLAFLRPEDFAWLRASKSRTAAKIEAKGPGVDSDHLASHSQSRPESTPDPKH